VGVARSSIGTSWQRIAAKATHPVEARQFTNVHGYERKLAESPTSAAGVLRQYSRVGRAFHEAVRVCAPVVMLGDRAGLVCCRYGGIVFFRSPLEAFAIGK
jgi:hypothetical protein